MVILSSFFGLNILGNNPATIDGCWRFVPPEDSISLLKKLSEITDDPNIIPPPPLQSNGEGSLLFRPRIPPRPSLVAPSMMMVMLRDFGPGSITSGFIVNGGQGFTKTTSTAPMILRQTVVFKNSTAVTHPNDLQRFVVVTFEDSRYLI